MSEYYKILIEKTDDALLTDDEVYNMKGGNFGMISKALVGFGGVAAYLFFSKRIAEVFRFEIRGSTFLKSNLVFFITAGLYQQLMLKENDSNRLRLHHSALFQRFMLNYSFMLQNKKKPKIH